MGGSQGFVEVIFLVHWCICRLFVLFYVVSASNSVHYSSVSVFSQRRYRSIAVRLTCAKRRPFGGGGVARVYLEERPSPGTL